MPEVTNESILVGGSGSKLLLIKCPFCGDAYTVGQLEPWVFLVMTLVSRIPLTNYIIHLVQTLVSKV